MLEYGISMLLKWNLSLKYTYSHIMAIPIIIIQITDNFILIINDIIKLRVLCRHNIVG